MGKKGKNHECQFDKNCIYKILLSSEDEKEKEEAAKKLLENSPSNYDVRMVMFNVKNLRKKCWELFNERFESNDLVWIMENFEKEFALKAWEKYEALVNPSRGDLRWIIEYAEEEKVKDRAAEKLLKKNPSPYDLFWICEFVQNSKIKRKVEKLMEKNK
jgi:hypothetical protein